MSRSESFWSRIAGFQASLAPTQAEGLPLAWLQDIGQGQG